MVDYKKISFLITALIVVSGVLYHTNTRDLCSQSMLWIPTGIPNQYYCESEDKTLFCYKLSSTKRTCYIAEFVETSRSLEIFANGKNYMCEGTEPYSHCYTKNNIHSYYGELHDG